MQTANASFPSTFIAVLFQNFLLITAFTALLVFKTQPGLAEDDFQYWSQYEIAKTLGPKWEIFYSPEFRVSEKKGELFFHRHREGLRWKPVPYLRLGVHYLMARTQPVRGEPLTEHRGEFEITPSYQWRQVNFSLRGRIELRQVQGSSGEEELRYRLEPRIAYRTQLLGHEVLPFIADEIFYDAERDAWNQNRVSAGISIPWDLSKKVKMTTDLFYLLQSQQSIQKDWSSNHIFGTALKVKF